MMDRWTHYRALTDKKASFLSLLYLKRTFMLHKNNNTQLHQVVSLC